MRVLDIQAKMKRVGVIRLGEEKKANGPGKRLATFRLTSNDRRALESVARLYGGQVMPWANGSQSWQITTTSNELPIELSNVPAITAYELWQQVGGSGSKQCIRRCDSCTIQQGIESGQACKCPTDPLVRAEQAKKSGSGVCSLTCRLFVRLPDVPDVGLWQVTTGSFYAAQEVPAIMDGIEALAQMGAHIRARLAIDIRKGGGKTFPVLAVRLNQSNDELRALAMQHFEQMKALDGADQVTKVAFKLGIPMTVVDGRMIQTVRDDQPALESTASTQPQLPVIESTERSGNMGDWDKKEGGK